MSRRRALVAGSTALAGALVIVAVRLASSDGDDAAGEVRFMRSTANETGVLVTDSSRSDQEFMRENYWRMRGHSPFYDPALEWAPPSHFYQDLYALHPTDPDDRGLVRRQPDLVLRDDQGRKLFIPFDCDGRRCAAWAANPGNSSWRRLWLARAREQLAKGYAGVFIDNVNMELRVGDGAGRLVPPVDPRTGEEMSLADWRRYVADFTEEIRSGLPDAEIVHNAIWYSDRSSPDVAREVEAADYVELERGASDPGLTGGDGKFGFESFLAHIDWLHDRGVGVIFEPYGLNEVLRSFELATYFLVAGGDDAIASSFEADPGNWWPGWETDLGEPEGERETWNGLLRRQFAEGMVLVNPPGAPARVADLDGEYENLDGEEVDRVSLEARQGLVLRSES